jgi:hypothetical protein
MYRGRQGLRCSKSFAVGRAGNNPENARNPAAARNTRKLKKPLHFHILRLRVYVNRVYPQPGRHPPPRTHASIGGDALPSHGTPAHSCVRALDDQTMSWSTTALRHRLIVGYRHSWSSLSWFRVRQGTEKASKALISECLLPTQRRRGRPSDGLPNGLTIHGVVLA